MNRANFRWVGGAIRALDGDSALSYAMLQTKA
jgi:hypothetical protein